MGGAGVALTNAAVERAAVFRGAGLTLAIAVPVIVVVAVLSHRSGQVSSLAFADPIALFIAFVAGGHLAARRQTAAPLMHAAAAGCLAMAALGAVSVGGHVIENKSVPIVSLVLYAQVAVGLAVVGGYIAMRRQRTS